MANEAPLTEAKAGRGRPPLENAIERVIRHQGQQQLSPMAQAARAAALAYANGRAEEGAKLAREAERLRAEAAARDDAPLLKADGAALAKDHAESIAAQVVPPAERASRAHAYLTKREEELRSKPPGTLEPAEAQKLATTTATGWRLVREHGKPREVTLTAEAIARIAVKETHYRKALAALDPALLPEVREKALLSGKQAQVRSAAAPQHEHAQQPDPTAMPQAVAGKFVRVGDMYHFSGGDKSLAFEDRGEKLVAKTNNAEVARALVAIAEARGWQDIAVLGTKQFRREAWREATLRGIEVRGYEPTELEKKEVERQSVARSGPNEVQKAAERAPEAASTAAASAPKPLDEVVFGTLLEHGDIPAEPRRVAGAEGKSHFVLGPSESYVKLGLENGGEKILRGEGLGEAWRTSQTRPAIGDVVGVAQVTATEGMPPGRATWVIEKQSYFAAPGGDEATHAAPLAPGSTQNDASAPPTVAESAQPAVAASTGRDAGSIEAREAMPTSAGRPASEAEVMDAAAPIVANAIGAVADVEKRVELATAWREHKGSLDQLVRQYPELLDAAAAYRSMVAEMERRPEYTRSPGQQRLEGVKAMLREGYGEMLERGRKIHAPRIVKTQLRDGSPERARAASRTEREEAVRAA